MKKLSTSIICSLLLGGLFAGAGSASAQSQYYWDATSPIHTSPGSGGAGFWSPSSANWWVSGSSDSAWVNGNIANFAGTAGTVTIATSLTANGLAFDVGGYILTNSSSATLTLAGTPTITLPGSGSTAINCPIAGTVPVAISGTGKLTLGAANTYSGATTIGSGSALSITIAGKLNGGTYAATIDDAGALNYNSSAAQTLSGVISDVGALAVNGTGTLTLKAANTYSGGTFIAHGSTLTVSTGGNLASAGAITNNGTFNFNNNISATLSGPITGTGSLSVNPLGALGSQVTLIGANTYTGSTTVALNGQMIIGSDSELGTPPATFTPNQLVMNAGFLKATATFTLNTNRGITFGTSSTLGGSIQVNGGQTLTIAAPITGANSFISGSGEANFGFGTTILAASNTFTGGTGISTGTLMLGTNGALPYGRSLIMAPDDFGGPFFNLNGYNQAIGALSTTNSFAGQPPGSGTPTIVLGGALTILQTNLVTGFNGTITGPGTLTFSGVGSASLTLSNADTYTGLTTINGGTLDGNVSGAIPGSVTVNGGELELDNVSAISSTATLTMGVGVTVNLNYSGSQIINGLTFGSTPQAQGLWGAPGNAGATFTDSRFTGAGLLLVCPAPQTITPAESPVCAGSTNMASVPTTPGATYAWSVNNGTIISGGSSATVVYSAWANSPVTLNCVVTSSCGNVSPGGQNVNVPVDVCGPLVEANSIGYDPVNGVTINGTGVLGANWNLTASPDISAPVPWPTIQSGTVTSSPFTVTDPNAIFFPVQFYDLITSP